MLTREKGGQQSKARIQWKIKKTHPDMTDWHRLRKTSEDGQCVQTTKNFLVTSVREIYWQQPA